MLFPSRKPGTRVVRQVVKLKSSKLQVLQRELSDMFGQLEESGSDIHLRFDQWMDGFGSSLDSVIISRHS